MTETTQGSGTPPEASGTQAGQPEPKPIRPEEHKKAVDDLMKFKQLAAKEAAEKQAALERQQELEEKLLSQQNDYKGLYEKSNETLKAEREEHKKLKEAIAYREKFTSVLSEAMKLGIRQEAVDDLERLDFEGVMLESSNGRMSVHGADQFVESLKKAKPHWFKAEQVPAFNAGGAGRAGTSQSDLSKKLSYEEMMQIKKKDPKKFEELLRNYKRAGA